jgi:hypothetical protein
MYLDHYINKCTITNSHKYYEGKIQDVERLQDYLRRSMSYMKTLILEGMTLNWDY